MLHRLLLVEFVFALSVTVYLLREAAPLDWLAIGLLSPVAVALADFVVGLAHMLADRAGRLGALEHHVDPADVLRESWVETLNAGHAVAVALLVVSGGLAFARNSPILLGSLAVFAVFLVSANALHRWAHANPRIHSVPGWILFLQKRGWIVGRSGHMRHHRPPHREQFTILTGWSEGLLQALARGLDRRAR